MYQLKCTRESSCQALEALGSDKLVRVRLIAAIFEPNAGGIEPLEEPGDRDVEGDRKSCDVAQGREDLSLLEAPYLWSAKKNWKIQRMRLHQTGAAGIHHRR